MRTVIAMLNQVIFVISRSKKFFSFIFQKEISYISDHIEIMSIYTAGMCTIKNVRVEGEQGW